jgi:hypothetical protein
MSGIGCLATIGVVAIVTCIVYLIRRARDAKSTRSETQPPMETVIQKPGKEKNRLSMPGSSYAEHGRDVAPTVTVEEAQATRVLREGHRMRRTVTMEYDTANPEPGRRAINIRDIDVYGLGNGYIDAFCHLRNEQRTFKISRIRWAQLAISTYPIPIGYVPSTWVKYGCGELSDKGVEDEKLITEEVSSTSASSAPPEKWTWPHVPPSADQAPSTGQANKPDATRKKVLPSERGEGPTKSYVSVDWQQHFEDSIKSPFPEEWSPALRYLHEAYQLEKEGADQAKIDQALQKAREADPKATDFYLSRQSIIKKQKRGQKRGKRQSTQE